MTDTKTVPQKYPLSAILKGQGDLTHIDVETNDDSDGVALPQGKQIPISSTAIVHPSQ